MRPCAIFTANRGFALSNSREMLIQRLLGSGWRVVIATADDPEARRLQRPEVTFEPVVFFRGGLGLIRDITAVLRLLTIYHRYRPTLVHHFHAKPVIMGTLATRFCRPRPKVVNTITGLGSAFNSSRALGRVAGLFYQIVARSADVTVFQNQDDQHFFQSQGWVHPGRTRLIVGSGVDLERFAPRARPTHQVIRVVMIARLLRDKGVEEFLTAARAVKAVYPKVALQLGGELEPQHPNAVDRKTIQRAEAEGAIEFLGYVDDVPSALADCSLFVLPSYYGEGVPRVLLEAAAAGVPVVAADAPGTREPVEHNVTGILVPPRDASALSDAIVTLLGDPKRRAAMGAAARQKAVAEFDIRRITERQLAIYKEVGALLE